MGKETSQASQPTFQPRQTRLGDAMQEKSRQEVQQSHVAIHNSADVQTTGQRGTRGQASQPSAPISEEYAGRKDSSRDTSGQRRPRGQASQASAPISEKTYVGRIDSFRGTYGWVNCAEVQERHDGRQVYLHWNDCVGNFNPRKWLKIVFQLAYDPRGPKAVNAQICSGSLDQTEHSKTIKLENRITL